MSAQLRFLRGNTFHGTDIADSVVRLVAMNLYLHGINPTDCSASRQDALRPAPEQRYALVLTNPPFGQESDAPGPDKKGRTDKDVSSRSLAPTSWLGVMPTNIRAYSARKPRWFCSMAGR